MLDQKKTRMLIGARVHMARRYRRMTQHQLASILGISQEQLSRIEHGKRGVDVAMIRRISEATRSSVLWLLAYPPEICQWCEGKEVFR